MFDSGPICVQIVVYVFLYVYVRDSCSPLHFVLLFVSALDLFTIKLFHGGVFDTQTKEYVGGGYDYVDGCSVDKMSLVDVNSMLKECGVLGSQTLSYKYPKSDWFRGVWNLESDSDVVEMCELVPPSRLVFVFAIAFEPLATVTSDGNLTQEYNPSQDPNLEFVETEDDRAFYRQMCDEYDWEPNQADEEENVENEEENAQFGNAKFGEDSDSDDEDYVVGQDELNEDYEVSEDSFHSDSSNVDSTDEDVCYYKTERAKKKAAKEKRQNKGKTTEKGKGKVTEKEKQKESTTTGTEHDMGTKGTEGTEGNVDYSSESTYYYDSEEERMAANSTDEDEIKWPVFYEKCEMGHPKFVLGQQFASAKIFRDAVKKQAIVERRPIVQCRNYGPRVRLVCSNGCEWKIYASKMSNSDTYQIKVYKPVHTCIQTFDQKQINSRWIANYYENDIRMNPTWPLSAFLKKVVNDWGCHVSIYAIARAKRKVPSYNDRRWIQNGGGLGSKKVCMQEMGTFRYTLLPCMCLHCMV